MAGSISRQPFRMMAIRMLAEGATQKVVAEHFGVAQPTVSEFASAYRVQIQEVAADLENEFAGLWIAEKAKRIASYMADIETIDRTIEWRMERLKSLGLDLEEIAAAGADPSLIRVKQRGLRNVAEEMGHLPARVQIAVTQQSVAYEVVGVDVGDLR